MCLNICLCRWLLSDRLVHRAISFIDEHSTFIDDDNDTRKHGGNSTKNLGSHNNDPISDFSKTSTSASSNNPFFVYFPLIHTHIPHTPKVKFLKESLQALGFADTDISTEKEYGEFLEFNRNKRVRSMVAASSVAPGGGGSKNKPPMHLVTEVERATYGAALREGDDMVKQVMEFLANHKDRDLYENTLTIVMSDNGPWLDQVILYDAIIIIIIIISRSIKTFSISV
jgi:arylsulfatase A-like enzyme